MMNLICRFRGHKWKDGNCLRCGAEHSPHEWAPQPGACVEKCVLCGKARTVGHVFSPRGGCEFVCTNCGETVLRHSFVRRSPCGEVCSICGAERAAHQWNTVKRKRRAPDGKPVELPGCRCTVCGAPNPDGEHTFVLRGTGRERARVCAICGLTIPGPEGPALPETPGQTPAQERDDA